MLRRSRSPQARQGSTVVEAAVIMALFLTFLFSIIEYGRYIALRQIGENAARVGARWCVVNTSYNANNGLPVGDKTQAIARVRAAMPAGVESQLSGFNIDVFKINPTDGSNAGAWDSAGSSDTIAVRVSGQFTFVVPNYLQLASAVLNVNITVTMRVE